MSKLQTPHAKAWGVMPLASARGVKDEKMNIKRLLGKTTVIRTLWKAVSPLLILALLASSIPVAVQVAYPTPVSAATTGDLISESNWTKGGRDGGFVPFPYSGFTGYALQVSEAWWGGEGHNICCKEWMHIKQSVGVSQHKDDISLGTVKANLSFKWFQGWEDELKVYLSFQPSEQTGPAGHLVFSHNRNSENYDSGTEQFTRDVPAGTTSIEVYVEGYAAYTVGNFVIGNVDLTLSGLTDAPSVGGLAFGNVYAEFSDEAAKYNSKISRTLEFENTYPKDADWTLDYPGWWEVSLDQGTLFKGNKQKVTIKVHPTTVGSFSDKVKITFGLAAAT
ncbi:MAG: hypothetical protein AAB037_01675, partial [Chloroflexota bacterium]